MLHVNSTPLHAFLILNLLVFLSPVRDHIRGSKWVPARVNYFTCNRSASVHHCVFVYASGRNSNTDIIVDSIYKRQEEPWKSEGKYTQISISCKLKCGTFQDALIGINSRQHTVRCSLRSVLYNSLLRPKMLSLWSEWFHRRTNIGTKC